MVIPYFWHFFKLSLVSRLWHRPSLCLSNSVTQDDCFGMTTKEMAMLLSHCHLSSGAAKNRTIPSIIPCYYSSYSFVLQLTADFCCETLKKNYIMNCTPTIKSLETDLTENQTKVVSWNFPSLEQCSKKSFQFLTLGFCGINAPKDQPGLITSRYTM